MAQSPFSVERKEADTYGIYCQRFERELLTFLAEPEIAKHIDAQEAREMLASCGITKTLAYLESKVAEAEAHG